MVKESKNYPTPSKSDYEFTRTYIEEKTGIKHTWYFHKGKMDRGPFKVEIDYPDDYVGDEENIEENNKNLPITQQKFWSETTKKYVGYARAKALKII